MNLVDAALRKITSDLGRYAERWALVGGFAVSARAEPRFTRDIDIAVAVSDDETGFSRPLSTKTFRDWRRRD